MSNKMIIDASHPEETRVVVLRGNRVEEFDFEAANKKPLRGNIYLAKVTRVEPSLQAAFVEYGGNRHGFLAFSEIHPDYYQIPVADRQALLEEEARSHREEADEANGERRSRRRQRSRQPEVARAATDETISEPADDAEPRLLTQEQPREDLSAVGDEAGASEIDTADVAESNEADDTDLTSEISGEDAPYVASEDETGAEVAIDIGSERVLTPGEEVSAEMDDGFESVEADDVPSDEMTPRLETDEAPLVEGGDLDEEGPTLSIERQAARDEADQAREDAGLTTEDESGEDDDDAVEVTTLGGGEGEEPTRRVRARNDHHEEEGEPVEVIGGDAMDETPRRAARPRRHYKIQEVIKRRQVLLVQVVKEERGNKGAALTTYLSLAGRYSVLMPNTARGGGISRKITNAQDRGRLKAIADELDVPEGMGVILRTAGAARTKQEVKRDFEYLLRMWETVRETTLASSAPTLVYEEGSLIKRAIRDLYSKDIEEITVAGEAAFKEAKNFMRLLMPSNTRAVVPYRDTAPVFAKSGVEAQLDALFSNQVTLRSGGYIVINQTEALVAIDVNSGRSTREHNIEDTALRTNLEAADEVARQLRLRDLAGLIVVDFIDMEEGRNNRAVERRMKEALKNDRARIQVGRISHFGLLEMSRQRIRAGVLEGSTVPCPHCMGAGLVRSTSSVALHVLRVIEDALIRNAQFNVTVRARTPVAIYILNHKRAHLRELERRFGVDIVIEADETLANGVNHSLERGEPARGPRVEEVAHPPGYGVLPDDDFADEAPEAEAEEEEAPEAEAEEPETVEDEDERGETAESAEDAGRRRRRRRRRRGERGPGESIAAEAPQPADDGLERVAEIGGDFSAAVQPNGEEGERGNGARRGRRSRRGRRDRFGPRFGEAAEAGGEAAEAGGEAAEAGAPETVEAGEGEGYVAPLHGDPVLGGVESSAGMDEPPHSIAEALEQPLPSDFTPPSAPPEIAAATPAHELAAPETPAAPAPEATPDPDPQPAPEPVAEEPPRPRRTGWWARAKSTMVGE